MRPFTQNLATGHRPAYGTAPDFYPAGFLLEDVTALLVEKCAFKAKPSGSVPLLVSPTEVV